MFTKELADNHIVGRKTSIIWRHYGFVAGLVHCEEDLGREFSGRDGGVVNMVRGCGGVVSMVRGGLRVLEFEVLVKDLQTYYINQRRLQLMACSILKSALKQNTSKIETVTGIKSVLEKCQSCIHFHACNAYIRYSPPRCVIPILAHSYSPLRQNEPQRLQPCRNYPSKIQIICSYI